METVMEQFQRRPKIIQDQLRGYAIAMMLTAAALSVNEFVIGMIVSNILGAAAFTTVAASLPVYGICSLPAAFCSCSRRKPCALTTKSSACYRALPCNTTCCNSHPAKFLNGWHKICCISSPWATTRKRLRLRNWFRRLPGVTSWILSP